MDSKWNYETQTPERKQAAKELAEKIGMSPIMAHLLMRRGIRTESAAKRFFRPMLSELIDPFLMNDMDIAVDRLNDAMGRKERIMVYGDYDVDGLRQWLWSTSSCYNSTRTSSTTFPTAMKRATASARKVSTTPPP